MAAWSRKALKLFDNFCIFILEKWPLTIKFLKFSSKSFHCNTDRRVLFEMHEIWPTEICVIMHCLTEKKNEISLSSCRYCVDRAQSCQGQPLTMYSDCSSFHPNWFTFGGVIAECMNTAKVNPIFGWSLSLSRKISCSKHTIKKPCCISVHVSFWFKKIVHFSFTSD